MALSPRLEFRQSQSLVMTPQLMQAIKLLQLSNLDLHTYVEKELEQNPLLERADETVPADRREAETSVMENVGTDDADFSTPELKEHLETDPQAIANKLDTSADNLFPEDAGRAGIETSVDRMQSTAGGAAGSSASGGTGEGYNLEAFVSGEISLSEHLNQQIGLSFSDPIDLSFASLIIGNLDPSGYLRSDLDEMAETYGTSTVRLERVLSVIHTLDPVGVGARDLAECLTIQLKDKNRYDPAMATLLNNLDLLAKHDFKALTEICGVDMDDMAEMVEEIKNLDPKPGDAFNSALLATPVVPDVTVRAHPDGSWNIELNSDALPKVLVNQAYYATVSKTIKDESEKTFLIDCLQTANWLTKSLDQRAKTILRVATEIVRLQDGFLSKGVEYLRPLNLKTVADAVDVHESTVSRVTSNKYIATPRGVFELKYFFTSSIASTQNGESHSALSVRHKIKMLIDDELPSKILSDDKIVKLLQNDGVDIARRTVAKYREAMHISSSVQRRREKKAQASAGFK